MSQRQIPRPIVLPDVFGDTLSIYPSTDQVDGARAVICLHIEETTTHKQISWAGTGDALDLLISALCAERMKLRDSRPDVERVVAKQNEPARLRVKMPNGSIWECTRQEYLEFVRSQSESALALSMNRPKGAAA
jgi:hypothetical protein